MKYEDNYTIDYSARSKEQGEDELFRKRWSPRSFKKADVPQKIFQSIFSAAKWTQSCFNEQPWLFVTDSGDSDKDLFLDLLLPRNKKWAEESEMIGYIFARKSFEKNGKPNNFSAFDTGAAWMAMTLQARLFGLYTHGMAGINREDIYSRLNVSPDTYEVICGFVIGAIDQPDKLDEMTRSREKPSVRKELDEIWHRGVL